MKQKIVIHDNINDKVIIREIKLRNLEHFEAQKRMRANVFKDRTKYTRKVKHKGRDNFSL